MMYKIPKVTVDVKISILDKDNDVLTGNEDLKSYMGQTLKIRIASKDKVIKELNIKITDDMKCEKLSDLLFEKK